MPKPSGSGRVGLWGHNSAKVKAEARRTDLERSARAGDSPVVESGILASGTPSRSGHVEPGLNLGGPSPKAKYSLTTDSGPVA